MKKLTVIFTSAYQYKLVSYFYKEKPFYHTVANCTMSPSTRSTYAGNNRIGNVVQKVLFHRRNWSDPIWKRSL